MTESNLQQTQSPYTPTTEEVELYFKQAVPEPYGQELDNAFDRWLAEIKAQAWEEGQLALLKYMGVPLYPATGDESRNPEQPVNPYRQGEKQ